MRPWLGHLTHLFLSTSGDLPFLGKNMNTQELAGAGNGHEVMHYDTEGGTLLYKYVCVAFLFEYQESRDCSAVR